MRQRWVREPQRTCACTPGPWATRHCTHSSQGDTTHVSFYGEEPRALLCVRGRGLSVRLSSVMCRVQAGSGV